MSKPATTSPLLRRLVARAMVPLAMDKAPPVALAQGAGIAYVAPAGRALFLKRSDAGDHAGEWCFPGGSVELGETPEQAAVRESREEIGALPYGERQAMARTAMDGVEFRTFRQPIAREFTPKLNDEHTEHAWAPLDQPPQPLHPGVRAAIDCAMAMDGWLAMDEWAEGDHPRASNGQFGSGGASAAAPAPAPAAGGDVDKTIAGLFAHSLGMKRKDMPQVPAAVKPEFMRELAAKTTLKHEQVDASSLKPTQGDYKLDSIKHIAGQGVDPKNTIMVSSDGYVLDGHHRWAAAALNGTKLSTIKVGMPIRQLLEVANEFNDRAGVQRRTADPVAADAWVEADHPRAENGQFGSGGAGATHSSLSAAPEAHPPQETRQAVTQAPGAQAYMTPELYGEAKRLIALYSKEDVSTPLTPAEKARAQTELANHLAAAHAAKPGYDQTMKRLGKELDCEVLLAPVKGGERLLEKHIRDNNGNPAEMKDLVRGSLVVKSLDDVGQALEAIDKNFKVARKKDRFATPTEAGYSDVLITIELPGGIMGEIQVHIPEMLATKNDVGHGLYEIERKLPDGNPLKAQLQDMAKRVYGSAREVANQRLTSKRLKPVVSQDSNSALVSESPSLKALAPLGNGRESGDPLFSKATHSPLGNATTGMPSTSRNFEPSGASDSFIASPSAPILALGEDDNHWITVNGGEGHGQPVLVTEGGVVVGGAGGSLNGKTLSPNSKSKPVPDKSGGTERFANIQKSLQNRNRSSAASIAQMNRIASNPNPRLMMAAPTMNDGAPVVTDLAGKGIAKVTGHRDWIVTGKREIPVRYAVVEADQLAASNRADGTKNDDYGKDLEKLTAINNGRTAAMIEAYSRNTAGAYKDAIAKAERVHGIPGKTIKAMKAPVLVRLMDAADVDDQIGDESNATQTLSLSAIEQAQNDAARFDPTGIEFNDDGTPTDASVKGFINAMPAAERQSLSPNGKPTKQAIDRMMAATFSAAYGDNDLVGLMAQATDPESANLIKGMSKAAGAMAKLKDAGELDIRELVTGAAKQIINAVRSGVSIKKFLKQGDLLTSSAEDAIAALMAENARSSKALGEKLTAAAEFAYQESQRGGVDIFGEQIPTASRGEVLERLQAHDEKPPGDDLKALLVEAINGMRMGAADQANVAITAARTMAEAMTSAMRPAMDAILAQASKPPAEITVNLPPMVVENHQAAAAAPHVTVQPAAPSIVVQPAGAHVENIVNVPEGPREMRIVEMPSRVTTTEVKRGRDGDIESTKQVERDEK